MTAAAKPHHVVNHLHNDAHHRGDYSYKHDACNQELGVVVADMGQLMAQHTGKLLIIKQSEKSGGHRHGV